MKSRKKKFSFVLGTLNADRISTGDQDFLPDFEIFQPHKIKFFVKIVLEFLNSKLEIRGSIKL